MMREHAILLIEDDEFQREPMAILFQQHGYDVTAVAGGQEALDLLRAGLTPCVIVLDLSLPHMTGEEFRREQRGDPTIAMIPIILYSSGDNLLHTAGRLGRSRLCCQALRGSALEYGREPLLSWTSGGSPGVEVQR